MIETVKKIYKYLEWTQKFDVSHSFIELEDFLKQEDCLDFELVFKRMVDRESPRQLFCTVWINPANFAQSLLIDFYENNSFNESKEDMLEILASTQQMPLPNGPEDLGDISFVSPNEKVPIVHWILNRFFVSVKSFGSDAANVTECAYRISKRLKSVLDAKKI